MRKESKYQYFHLSQVEGLKTLYPKVPKYYSISCTFSDPEYFNLLKTNDIQHIDGYNSQNADIIFDEDNKSEFPTNYYFHIRAIDQLLYASMKDAAISAKEIAESINEKFKENNKNSGNRLFIKGYDSFPSIIELGTDHIAKVRFIFGVNTYTKSEAKKHGYLIKQK